MGLQIGALALGLELAVLVLGAAAERLAPLPTALAQLLILVARQLLELVLLLLGLALDLLAAIARFALELLAALLGLTVELLAVIAALLVDVATALAALGIDVAAALTAALLELGALVLALPLDVAALVLALALELGALVLAIAFELGALVLAIALQLGALGLALAFDLGALALRQAVDVAAARGPFALDRRLVGVGIAGERLEDLLGPFERVEIAKAEALHRERRGGQLRAGGGPAAAARLLDDVGQLVGEEAAAVWRFGISLAVAERDVLADGEGAGAEIAGQPRGGRAEVNAHVGEIAAKACLEEAADALGERGAAGAQLGDAAGEALGDLGAAVASAGGSASSSGRLAEDLGGRDLGGGDVDDRRGDGVLGGGEHGVGGLVGFALVSIVGLAHGERGGRGERGLGGRRGGGLGRGLGGSSGVGGDRGGRGIGVGSGCSGSGGSGGLGRSGGSGRSGGGGGERRRRRGGLPRGFRSGRSKRSGRSGLLGRGGLGGGVLGGGRMWGGCRRRRTRRSRRVAGRGGLRRCCGRGSRRHLVHRRRSAGERAICGRRRSDGGARCRSGTESRGVGGARQGGGGGCAAAEVLVRMSRIDLVPRRGQARAQLGGRVGQAGRPRLDSAADARVMSLPIGVRRRAAAFAGAGLQARRRSLVGARFALSDERFGARLGGGSGDGGGSGGEQRRRIGSVRRVGYSRRRRGGSGGVRRIAMGGRGRGTAAFVCALVAAFVCALVAVFVGGPGSWRVGLGSKLGRSGIPARHRGFALLVFGARFVAGRILCSRLGRLAVGRRVGLGVGLGFGPGFGLDRSASGGRLGRPLQPGHGFLGGELEPLAGLELRRVRDLRRGISGERGGRRRGAIELLGGRLRLLLGGLARLADLEAALLLGLAALRLRHVSQLVGEQLAPRRGLGREGAGGEEDVWPDGEGLGAERLRRLRRRLPGVDANPLQGDAEPLLHLEAERGR